MTFGKIQSSTSVNEASVELENDVLYVTHLHKDKKKLLRALEPALKKSKNKYPSISTLYFNNSEIDWEYDEYLEKISKGSMSKDFLYYARCFRYELLTRLKEYPYARRFIKRNPIYCLVVANWIFNNHLMNYNKYYQQINKSIILYSDDLNIGYKVLYHTYLTMRFGGCDMDSIIDRSPLQQYGSELIPNPRVLSTQWDRNFLMLQTSNVSVIEVDSLLSFIDQHDGGLFGNVFPAFILAPTKHRKPENKRLLLEFNCDD